MTDIVIGVTGYAQVGKTSVLDCVQQVIGGIYISFAEPLRRILHDMNPYLRVKTSSMINVSYLDYRTAIKINGYEWAKTHTNLRDYMVGLGAGARNHIGRDVWVDAAAVRLTFGDGVMLVPDVRYVNEARLVLVQAAGVVIRVDRPGVGPANEEEGVQQAKTDDCLDYYQNDDEYSPRIFSVVNDGTIGDLFNKVHSILDVVV